MREMEAYSVIMVQRKSEYQNQFKPSITQDHQPEYLENLTFRHNRRNREFLHTPICWGVVDDEEVLSSDNEDNCDAKSKTKIIRSDEPQYQSLAEILAESSKKNEAFRQKRGNFFKELDFEKISFDIEEKKDIISGTELELSLPKSIDEAIEANKDYCKENEKEKYTSFHKQKIIDDSDKEFDVDDESKVINKGRKYFLSGSKKQKNSKQPPSNAQSSLRLKLINGTGKPKRPDRQGTIPRLIQSRSSVFSSTSMEKPPFVSYGVGDQESTLAIHRTHNVRSSCDVYSQALKAQRMREAEKRRRQKEKKKAIKNTTALLDKLSIVTPRDSMSWQSEYRKQFHGYDPKEYERAMSSSRAVISHSTPINAVHRGGCLLVHVD